MDVKRFRLVNGLKTSDIVAVMRTEYPLYSKMTNCMVEHPEKYGVKLIPEAEALLEQEITGGRRGDRHRNRYRLVCRVTKDRYEEVKQAVEADGRFPTVQAFLDWWVYVWVKKQQKGGKTDESTL